MDTLNNIIDFSKVTLSDRGPTGSLTTTPLTVILTLRPILFELYFLFLFTTGTSNMETLPADRMDQLEGNLIVNTHLCNNFRNNVCSARQGRKRFNQLSDQLLCSFLHHDQCVKMFLDLCEKIPEKFKNSQ